MEIPDLSNVMLTPGEAEFIHFWTVESHPAVSEKVRAARLAFAEKYPPDVEATIDGVGLIGEVIVAYEDYSSKPISDEDQQEWLEEHDLELAAEVAKDEVGVEQHLVGPLELSVEELQIFCETAVRIGALASEELVEYQNALDERGPGWEWYQEEGIPDTLQRMAVASSIQNAVHAYVDTGNPS